MGWQDKLSKAFEQAIKQTASQGSSRYDDEWIKEILRDQDEDIFKLRSDLVLRIVAIEKTQRQIIKELEKLRVSDRLPTKPKKSVLPPVVADPPAPITLSRSYKYQSTMTEGQKETWRKIPQLSGNSGELVAIISGLDNLTGKTSWLFHVKTKHEQLAALVYGGKIYLETTAGYDTAKSKAKRGRGINFNLKPDKHRVVFKWDTKRFSYSTYRSNGKLLNKTSMKILAPIQGNVNIAIGRQALPWGNRDNVGDNVIVHEAILGLE